MARDNIRLLPQQIYVAASVMRQQIVARYAALWQRQYCLERERCCYVVLPKTLFDTNIEARYDYFAFIMRSRADEYAMSVIDYDNIR